MPQDPFQLAPATNAKSECHRMREELKERFKTQKFGILVFGRPGFGKSAMVNTIQRAFLAPGTAKVGDRREWGSTHTKKFEAHAVKDCKIVVWDTFGWESVYNGSNYSIDGLNRMLRGFVPNGHEHNKPVSDFYEIKEERKTDAVILAIPSVVANDESELGLLWNGDQRDRDARNTKNSPLAGQPIGLRDVYAAIKALKLPVIVAITKIDDESPGGPFSATPNFNRLTTEYSTVRLSREWDRLQKSVSTTLKDFDGPIVPWLSYTHTDSGRAEFPSLEEFALRGVYELAQPFLRKAEGPIVGAKGSESSDAPDFYVWDREHKFLKELVTEGEIRR